MAKPRPAQIAALFDPGQKPYGDLSGSTLCFKPALGPIPNPPLCRPRDLHPGPTIYRINQVGSRDQQHRRGIRRPPFGEKRKITAPPPTIQPRARVGRGRAILRRFGRNYFYPPRAGPPDFVTLNHYPGACGSSVGVRKSLILWCCRRGSNPRPPPYQGGALPLSYGSAGQSVWAAPGDTRGPAD
jgi:hypothetical protein